MDKWKQKLIKNHDPRQPLNLFLVFILLLIIGYNIDRFSDARGYLIEQTKSAIRWIDTKDFNPGKE